ncbi:MAG TPA: response regulator [Thermomicrobiales bacterium]|nr:response regulator [Thermomicrobiales bacterium]
MEPRAIVIVEDNEPIAGLIQEVLNEVPGYGAVTVPDGRQALAVIAAVRAGLVILDVDLPGLDGFALYDRLRARPATAGIPILFMSATAHEPELAARDIRDYLRKPFDLDDLLARVRAIFEQGPPPA